MLLTANELGDTANVIRCATHILKSDKYLPGILQPFLSALKTPGKEASDDEIIELLSKLYYFNNIKDKLFIIRAAKDAGCAEIASRVLQMVSKAELDWLKDGDAAVTEG
jgi:hypothetical protein